MSAVNQPPEFVDTNILIYAHDSSAGLKHQRAKQLVAELWNNRTGALSIQVLQEFYVNVTSKVAHPLDPAAASQLIAELASWQVHQPAVQDLLDAIELQTSYQLSFWDAMILTSAIASGCETVWSEDMNPGQSYGTILVKNPFA